MAGEHLARLVETHDAEMLSIYGQAGALVAALAIVAAIPWIWIGFL
jgi:hypothetical protein